VRILLMTEPVTQQPATAGARYALELARAWSLSGKRPGEESRSHELVVLSTPTEAAKLELPFVETIYTDTKWDFVQKVKLISSLPKLLSEVDCVQTFNTPRPVTDYIIRRTSQKRGREIRMIRVIPNMRGWNDRKLAPIGDMFICSSTFTHTQLEGAARYENLLHITPGIDCNNKQYTKDESMKDKKGAVTFIYPGDFTDIGNAGHIIDAVEFCNEKGGDLKVILVGRARDSIEKKAKIKIEEKIAKSGVSNSITIASYTSDEFHKQMETASVVIFPVTSLRQKFDIPFSLLDAMNAGVPVISSDFGPLGELASRGGTVLVEPGDGPQLGSVMLKMARDNHYYNSVSKDAKASVKEYFSSNFMAEQYGAVYDELAN